MSGNSNDDHSFESPVDLQVQLLQNEFGMKTNDAERASKLLQPKGYDNSAAFEFIDFANLVRVLNDGALASKVMSGISRWKQRQASQALVHVQQQENQQGLMTWDYRYGQPQSKRKANVRVDLSFVKFSELGGGKKWKSVQHGSDFLSDAKDFITSSWGLDESNCLASPYELHLACYVQGVPNRIEFTESTGYWDLTPTSPVIYFWVGSKEDSPARLQENLQRGMDRLANEVKRLKTVSTTAKDQIDRWNERSELSIEELEAAFPPINETNSTGSTAAKKLITNGPAGKEESDVQDMWNSALTKMVAVSSWKDCRSPHGIQFDGRRHDIDLVLLTKDIVSILYLDTSIELKDTIATDAKRCEVVLQLLARFGATFDGQPKRRECWGLGMDDSRVVFVKCANDNNMSYRVSPNCDLKGSGWELLLRFLKAPPSSRGYIPVTMPVLFGRSPLSLLAPKIYLLDEETVCKVGPQEQITHEHAMLMSMAAHAQYLAPAVRKNETFETSNYDFPFAFQMSLLQVPIVRSEADVVEVTSSIFWCLGTLHQIGIVHRDVKPSNILFNSNSKLKYILSDYEAAQHWKTGQRMSVASSDAFSSLPGEFKNTDSSMYHRDNEALFWSVFAMWLQVLKNRETPGAFRVSRQVDLSVLRDRGGAFVGDSVGTLYKPHSTALKGFLVGQARSRELWQPSLVFARFYEENMSVEDFNEKACSKGYFPCPEYIFDLLRSKKET